MLEVGLLMRVVHYFQQQGFGPTREEKAYQLLCTYPTKTSIMLVTCLRSSDEPVFDLHANQFVFLIRQLTTLWTTASTIAPVRAEPGDMSRSVVDMGWIPVLYYTAHGCQVPRPPYQATSNQVARIYLPPRTYMGCEDSSVCCAKSVTNGRKRLLQGR